MPTQIQGIEFEVIGSGASEAAQSLDALTASLKKLKGVAGTKIGISSIAKEVREATKGGSASLKKFADGIEAIATAANKLSGANSGLKSFAESISTLSSAKASAKTWDNISIGISKVGIAASAITPQALDKLDHMADALAKLSGVDLKGIGSALSGVRTNGKTTATPTPLPQDFQDAISAGDKLDMLRLKVITLRDALQTAFNKGDLTGAIRIREQILSVEEAIQKLEDKANAPYPALEALKSSLASMGKSALKAGMNLAAIPFRRLANSVSGLSDRFKTLASSLKRIAFYRFIRTIIKEITKGLQEGIKNLYGWSKAFGGAIMNGKNFAKTMDGIATSTLYLKNSIGAMVAPIISALAPAIDFIIDKVVALINVVNQLFALLGGATSWNKAIRKATEYEEATGGAGKAAKDAMHYLAPFDELNVLPEDKSGGGGGGKKPTDFSGMFEEETEFLQGLKSFTNVVKRLIEEGDWERLGTLLGNKINELIGKIPFEEIGKKVGEKINAWFTTKYWTLETINFHAIGQNIATFLNNMLYEIDFETLGRTITQPFTNLGDLIIGALSTVDWSRVGSSIKDFIIGAFKQMSDFLDKYDWTEVGTKLFEGLNEFISGLDPMQVLWGVVEFAGKLASAIYQIIQGFLMGNKTFTDESGVEWKFNVDGTLVKVEDKVPKKDKKLQGLQGVIDKIEDKLTDTDKQLELDGKVTKAVDATHSATVISAVAEIIEAYDMTLRDPLVGAVAALQRWEKANGFDSTISDMAAEFIKWGVTAGFGRQISDMVAVFTKWKKDNPTAFNTLTDMVASFKSHMKANGFPNTLSGIVAGFASWIKEDPTRFNKITGLVANLASWAKENGFSNTISGFTAALTSYLKQFDDPTIQALASIVGSVDFTDGENYVNAIADIIQANPALADDPLIQAIAEILDVWIDPNTYAVIPGYVDPEEDEPYVYIPPAGSGGGGRQDPLEGYLENGGVFSGGFWHSIPRFANGGISHGSMFVAGENGAELVGHIGGRTEVLNRSQIAATMYASMNSALRSSEPNEGVSEDAMYRAFRRALDETDFGGDIELDGDTLYSAMVTRNNRNTRMTGVNAFA